eukprot:6258665-Pyramimonas_sp.AAC.1
MTERGLLAELEPKENRPLLILQRARSLSLLHLSCGLAQKLGITSRSRRSSGIFANDIETPTAGKTGSRK